MARKLLLLLASLFSVSTWAAISTDATSGVSVGVGTTLSHSHTIGSGSDRILLCWAQEDVSGSSITGITYNSVAMTLGALVEQGNTGQAVYYMLDSALPSTGSYTAEVTISAAGSKFLWCESFAGVAQGAPQVQTNVATSGTTISATVTSVGSGAYVLTSAGERDTTADCTHATNFSEDYDTSQAGGSGQSSFCGAKNSTDTGSVTGTTTFDETIARAVLTVVAIEQAAASTPILADATVDGSWATGEHYWDIAFTISSDIGGTPTDCNLSTGDTLTVAGTAGTTNCTTSGCYCRALVEDMADGDTLNDTPIDTVMTMTVDDNTTTTNSSANFQLVGPPCTEPGCTEQKIVSMCNDTGGACALDSLWTGNINPAGTPAQDYVEEGDVCLLTWVTACAGSTEDGSGSGGDGGGIIVDTIPSTGGACWRCFDADGNGWSNAYLEDLTSSADTTAPDVSSCTLTITDGVASGSFITTETNGLAANGNGAFFWLTTQQTATLAEILANAQFTRNVTESPVVIGGMTVTESGNYRLHCAHQDEAGNSDAGSADTSVASTVDVGGGEPETGEGGGQEILTGCDNITQPLTITLQTEISPRVSCNANAETSGT